MFLSRPPKTVIASSPASRAIFVKRGIGDRRSGSEIGDRGWGSVCSPWPRRGEGGSRGTPNQDKAIAIAPVPTRSPRTGAMVSSATGSRWRAVLAFAASPPPESPWRRRGCSPRRRQPGAPRISISARSSSSGVATARPRCRCCGRRRGSRLHDGVIQNHLGEALERIGALDAAVDAYRAAADARPAHAARVEQSRARAGEGRPIGRRDRPRARVGGGSARRSRNAGSRSGLAQADVDVDGAIDSFHRALALDRTARARALQPRARPLSRRPPAAGARRAARGARDPAQARGPLHARASSTGTRVISIAP